MARGISLHIGLNKVDPDQYGGWDGTLNACESDANDMKAIADSRGFESNILLTSDASAEAVLAGIDRAAGELDSGDMFLLTYSGHGGQVPDRDDEGETDGSDETWVAYDREIVDDELYARWAKFKPGVRILVLSDSCHSGTVTRRIDAERPEPGRDAGERRLILAALPRHAEGRHDRDVPRARGPL